MPTITVTLSEAENKALEYTAISVPDWVSNAAKNRSSKAKQEIISILVEHCNANNISLAVGEDAQITQAFDLGVVKTAVQRAADLALED